MNNAQDQFVGGQTYTDSITVKTTDGTEQVITVTILGTNDAPLIVNFEVARGGASADQGSQINANRLMGTFKAVDSDGGGAVTFSLAYLAKNGDNSTNPFTLDPITGQLTSNTNVPAGTWHVAVTVTQGSQTSVRNATIIVDGNGNTQIVGNSDLDIIYGQQGGDTLIGGQGNDSLIGGTGNDRLIGGAGNDQLHGGNGNDVFVIAQDDGIDLILDFARLGSSQDKIELNFDLGGGSFVGLVGLFDQAGNLLPSAFKLIGTNHQLDGDDRILFNQNDGTLWYDPDGSGSMAAIQLAIVTSADGSIPILSSTDFLIV
jgi:Ca2+-binding RTX toxin-like protein